ncbi:hypothetical protein KXD93_10815 [Mucilaginibacter sp. BJC16-A38]|uniref:ligand-binding sensor domain-containing protein n=1 Tax=Mucilaginibacter phenanthrenivorans TaxID=1234842 RepID=UPI00215806D4|nr:hypothetical protein [Mucilaginibacter phenanthrenivorans]MCR8558139.1 hypothetical protein [Mucilaginibacter phenanthrenivorans]
MSAVATPPQISKLSLIILLILLLPAGLSAQNLFLEKIDVCNTSNYCMDCGDPKATCDQIILDNIAEKTQRKYMLGDFNGSLSFQVLVDPTGFGCVLSHTDVTNSPLTADLIRYLNGFVWKPARVNGKIVTSCVIVVFHIAYGRMSAQIQRIDLTQLKPPGDPIVYNKTVYANPSLKTYDFTVWTKYNSPLPDNISLSCTVDKSDVLWYATAKGLTRFDGENFGPVNEFNSPFTGQTAIGGITTDKDNNKWVYVDNKIYKCTDDKWQIYDFKKFLDAGVTHILNSSNGKLLFTTNDGLVAVRNDKVALLNKKNIPQLPSNDISYAYVDIRKRLWIGTSKGSIMIDKDFFVTAFNKTNTPLKNMCISGAVEDEKGNLYFSLVDFNKLSADDDKEGIAVMNTKGNWFHYNDKNSGMPSNHVNNLLYDKFEHVLWIGTDQSGIVRFDLKDGWENYHNANSTAPGYEIFQLVQDSKGVIYATTANGLLRIRKKAGS